MTETQNIENELTGSTPQETEGGNISAAVLLSLYTRCGIDPAAFMSPDLLSKAPHDGLVQLTSHLTEMARAKIGGILTLIDTERDLNKTVEILGKTQESLEGEVYRLESERARLEISVAELRRKVRIDPLTECNTLETFSDDFREAYYRALRERRTLSVTFIDLNGFKLINDMLGHQYGDSVLNRFSSHLRKELRIGLDTAVRYGGDEFIILSEHREEKLWRIIRHQARFTRRLVEVVTEGMQSPDYDTFGFAVGTAFLSFGDHGCVFSGRWLRGGFRGIKDHYRRVTDTASPDLWERNEYVDKAHKVYGAANVTQEDYFSHHLLYGTWLIGDSDKRMYEAKSESNHGRM